ncbi:MAG: hypothetical protein GQ574_28915 [Crocinitomix sp.]|nr:hypothetical protein [Crocinitomix sp.]
MKYILILFILIPTYSLTQTSDITWGTILENKAYGKSQFLFKKNDFIYELHDIKNKKEIWKINSDNLQIVNRVEIELKWNNNEHHLIKGFVFGGRQWLFTWTHNQAKGTSTTWTHSFDISTLSISEPTHIFDYNSPNTKTLKIVGDDYTTRIFSRSMMRIETSMLGQYAMVMSCKGLVKNLHVKNKEKQQPRTFQTQLFTDSFENSEVADFKPPADNFYIEQSYIDLDGSVYMLGRSIDVALNNSNMPKISNYHDLQLLKYDPISGDYISEKIEADKPFYTNNKLLVDGDLHFVSLYDLPENDKTQLIYKSYNSDLINKRSFNCEVGNAHINIGSKEDLARESKYEVHGPKGKRVFPIEFDFVFFEKLNNGDALCILEKRSLLYAGDKNYYLSGDLLLFCFNSDSVKWTKKIEKDQKAISTEFEVNHLGTYAYLQNDKIHLYYNESPYKTEMESNSFTIKFDEFQPNHIKHIILAYDGAITEQSNFTIQGSKKPLFIEPDNCAEIAPGVIRMAASNKKERKIGIHKLSN